MTTDVIDINIHGSAFPTSYTGTGTLIGNPKYNADADILTGNFTSDGNAVSIDIGFEARHIEIVNTTDTIKWEWMAGFPATDTLKVTSSASAVDTGSAIVVTTDLDGHSTVLLSSGLAGTSKNICYKVMG